MLLAGWLAGHGHPRIQRPTPLRVKGCSRGADNNQFASIQDRNKEAYKLQAARMQDYRDYKATRLQGLQATCCKDMLHSLEALKGRRIQYMYHIYIYIYIYIYTEVR